MPGADLGDGIQVRWGTTPTTDTSTAWTRWWKVPGMSRSMSASDSSKVIFPALRNAVWNANGNRSASESLMAIGCER